MKTFSLLTLLLVLSATGTRGQATAPAPTPYTVAARTANSAVWQRQIYEPTPDGKFMPQTERYVELATGLNHLVDGQYLPSSDRILLSPDGTSASSTNCQHQVFFPANIYNGVIKLVEPGGKILVSQPIGLGYSDGSNSVLLAVVTNAIGAILPSGNQVVYTNAFAGLKADLLYRNTKAGLEQDVVLLQQPPDPGTLGLNAVKTRLQIITEFHSSPSPGITAQMVPTAAGNLEDDSLSFGAMRMGRGKAFLVGSQTPSVAVEKHWVVLNGRQFLIEQVPIVSIAKAIDSLPPFVAQARTATKPVICKNLIPPPPRSVHSSPKIVFLAQAAPPDRGLVLDYITMTSQTNWVFQGDTTYYISGTVNLSGTNTFEGGTVLKYATNASVNLESDTGLNWLGTAYRPVVMTAMDDNSVGGTISGSTGNPTNYYYADPALYLAVADAVPAIADFRIAYAKQGLSGRAQTIRNAQFFNCQEGVSIQQEYDTWFFGNALFADVQTNFNSPVDIAQVDAQNVTFSGSAVVLAGQTGESGVTLAATNCLFADVNALSNNYVYSLDGDFNGFYSSPEFGSDQVPDDSYPFQTVGGGGYYLADECPFLNAGTTNIPPDLLADLATKTTYPPILYSNVIFTTAQTFNPQAQRDTDTPDLGYHYDPLDYAFGGCTASNNITFTAGTAVGWFRTTSGWYHAGYGIVMSNDMFATFQGTATVPDYWVRLNAVQEDDASAGYGPGGLVGQDNQYAEDISLSPEVRLFFTHCSMMSGDPGEFFRDDSGYLIVRANHSEFYSRGLGGYVMSCYLTNCLMDRAGVGQDQGYPSNAFIMQNCTFHGGSVYLTPNYSDIPVSIRDCAFDGTTFTETYYATNGYYDYNAYTNSAPQLPNSGTHDVIVTNAFDWEAGPLGNYYLPTNSLLISAGDVPADQVGLYHFTVQTNMVLNGSVYQEVPEGTNIVSIGYHYVAVDQNGNPLDSNGDGVPDYLEDANGNGVVDSGEIGWNITGDLGLNVVITQPRNGSILP